MHRRFPKPPPFTVSNSPSPLFRSPPIPVDRRLPGRRLHSLLPLELPLIAQHDPTQWDADYTAMVRRYVGSRLPGDAENLHLLLIKKGYSSDLFLSNNLISLYARTGNPSHAHHIFDQIPDKNSISWTCLIAGYTQQGLPDDAFSLFKSMISLGFEPTHFTLGSVLRSCQESGPDGLPLGSQIHGRILKTQYVLDTVVCNSLISMYGSCCLGSSSNARRVFDEMLMRNTISWNAIISVLARKGDGVGAFDLFSGMQKEECGFRVEPSEYTFGSLITMAYSSSSSSSRCLLEQMLVRVYKAGFLSDLYVGSALVSAFARFGLLDRSKEILLQMTARNAVSVNGLMVGLVKQKLGEEAVEIFRETKDPAVKNYDSYVVLLSAFAEFSNPDEGRRLGREVHGLMVTTGVMDSKIAIGNGLVNMYAKCGAIGEANRVFDLMNSRDQVSWNTIITALDQNKHFEEAVVNFRMMLRAGVMPSNFAVISTLSSCASMELLGTGAQLHCTGIKLGLDYDVSVSNSLLTMYGDCGHVSKCWRVFNYMPDYDQISWNSMIGALANSGASLQESVGVFSDMMHSGWKPNKVTFVNILAALSPHSVLNLSKQIHALVLKHGVMGDSAMENALLSCYAKSGEMDGCQRLFSEMSNRRDDVSWNTMIAGYIQNGLLSKAMDFVWFMMQNGQHMDCFTFATVLSACASIAASERGMEIHAFGIRSHLESDVVVESALIDMYAKCGRIDYAAKVFQSMNFKNEFSWNSMISGYARNGYGEKALELFKEMQTVDQQPDHVTFVGILSACSHAGLLEQGLHYFELMSRDYGLVPQMEHYSCVVDLLGRAGKLEKVEDFIKRMPVSPNILVWRTVLVSCCRSKDGAKTDIGKQALDMLLELEPQNPVNYVLASTLYASRGRWDDVARARAAMRLVPARKEPGCSWVTLRDGLHVFVAGDKSHPDSDVVYAKLRFLNQKIKDAGYVPQTEFALYDLEAESKEELLSYHSEKLAVAFVLSRSSGGPIRIMKNLRVCGDCHSAFVYISKVVGRQIVLRDSNRFHHFDNGKCSCADYW